MVALPHLQPPLIPISFLMPAIPYRLDITGTEKTISKTK